MDIKKIIVSKDTCSEFEKITNSLLALEKMLNITREGGETIYCLPDMIGVIANWLDEMVTTVFLKPEDFEMALLEPHKPNFEPNIDEKTNEELGKLNNIASIAVICNLAVKALDFDYEEERSSLLKLLAQIECDSKAAGKNIQEIINNLKQRS